VERATDWIRLWRELVEAQATVEPAETERDRWQRKSKDLNASVRRRWAKPDSSRDFLIAQLDAAPGSTLLDVGAGTGSWAILLSRHVRQVTAVDSSAAMIQVMRENMRTEKVSNVEIVHGAWLDVSVAPHDFSLCSHAMYGAADLPTFIRRMVEATRHKVFLLMRAPTADGIMAEAAVHIWGHPYDSPNFQVGYNALLQMGIFPNVLMENSGLWTPWTSPSLEEALNEIKRRFGLGQVSEHDNFLIDLLKRRLTLEEGHYVWTRSIHSALLYWDIGR
jgi:2-polyprenyl-3-methyl-5-hydroxy-6-metoxy-1,4-benzoquinol methylase